MAAVRRLTSEHRLLLAIVAVGGLVRFATLGSQDYWFDELLTTELITVDLSELQGRVVAAEASPPLYAMVAFVWERLFGTDEVAVRALSALLGTATIPVVYAAGRALVSRSAGLAAAALTAFSPLMIWYSQEARGYALLGLLTAISFLCFVRVLRGSDQRWLWAWVIASALAIAAHHLSVLPTVAEAGWLLWARRDARGEVALATGAVAVTGLVVAPLAAAQQVHGSWIGLLEFPDRVLALPQHFVVGLNVPSQVFGPLVLAVLVLVGGYALARMRPADRRPIWVAGGIVAAVVAAALLAAAVGSDYLVTRNLISLWAPFAVAVGGLLVARATSWLGPAVLGGVCALGLGLAVWNAATPQAGRPDWGEVVSGLGAPQHERAIVTNPLASSVAYYLDGYRRVGPGEVVTVSEVAVIGLRRVPNYAIGPCWWLGFCGGEDMWGSSAVTIEVPPGFELVDEGSTDLFTYRRYVAPKPLPLPAPATLDGTFVQPPAG